MQVNRNGFSEKDYIYIKMSNSNKLFLITEENVLHFNRLIRHLIVNDNKLKLHSLLKKKDFVSRNFIKHEIMTNLNNTREVAS